MIVTVMKTTYVKEEPKLIFYRVFKRYDDLMFRVNLNQSLTSDQENNFNFQKFQKIFLAVLEVHTPLKRKLMHANEVPYMTKTV